MSGTGGKFSYVQHSLQETRNSTRADVQHDTNTVWRDTWIVEVEINRIWRERIECAEKNRI
jgi:hypothetical protein